MKFVSKSNNLCITLRPGIQANPLGGTPADPGLHVRFDQGMATINDEKLIQMAKSHRGFNVDFFEVNEENPTDPFSRNRKDLEPAHSISDIKYGQVEKTVNSKVPFKLPAEVQNAVTEMAKSMAAEMAKEMVKEAIPQIAAEMAKKMASENKEPEAPTPTVEPEKEEDSKDAEGNEENGTTGKKAKENKK